MKTILILFLSFLTFHFSNAKELNCSINKNIEKFYAAAIKTELNQKILLLKGDTLTTYVTEKENENFEIESFIPDLELRFYGQGVIKEKQDQLKSSIWTRDFIIDISCKNNIN